MQMNGTRRDAVDKALKGEAFPGAWLAGRLGVEPTRLESRRRAGELLAVRNGRDYLYPAWQFGADGEPLPAIGRVVRAAIEGGIDGRALYELLLRRDGLTGGRRLVDAVLGGRDDRVIQMIRAGRPGEYPAVTP